jgi:predicted O-methyltransferase YrrM
VGEAIAVGPDLAYPWRGMGQTSSSKPDLAPEERGARKFRADPALARTWGGPFNGQGGRCRIFAELVEALRPDVILETGTYRGTTTEWIAAFQLPVHSIESEPESFGFARERLKATDNVTLYLDDSRRCLRRLLEEVVPAEAGVLAYLDAHWEDDLPLREELQILFGARAGAAVMIDDFQVPDDPGYRYDRYGEVALTADFIRPEIGRFGLTPLYPRLRGALETGARRGCVVLLPPGRDPSQLRTLRQAG